MCVYVVCMNHTKKETGHSLLSGRISVALCVLTALKIPRKKCRVGKVILVLGKSKNFGRLCLGNKMTSLKSC